MHSYIIVIFNQNINESPTYTTLISMLRAFPHESKLYIWDNSEVMQHNSAVKSDLTCLEIEYHHSPNNEKLSVLYNKIMSKCFSTGSTYLTILDQDSYIPIDFKRNIDAAPREYLIVPKVSSDKNGKLISPRYQKYSYLSNHCESDYIDSSMDSGLLPSKNMFAVGSGMTITKKIWDSGIRFREVLSFYGVDTEFCFDYSQKKEFFYLIDSNMQHSASNELEQSYEIFKWRLGKYFEHWQYQLVEHQKLHPLIARFYVSVTYNIVKLKNRIKRFRKYLLFKIN